MIIDGPQTYQQNGIDGSCRLYRHLICTFGGRQWQIKQVYVAIMLICSSHGTLGSKSELIVQAPPGVGRPSTILKDILLHMEPPWEGGTNGAGRITKMDHV